MQETQNPAPRLARCETCKAERPIDECLTHEWPPVEVGRVPEGPVMATLKTFYCSAPCKDARPAERSAA